MSQTTQYQLTAQERQTLLDLNNVIGQHKVQVHDLNTQLEAAQKARVHANAMFEGALAMLANAHALPGAQLSPDFTTLTGIKTEEKSK